MMVLETETCSLIWLSDNKKRCVRLNSFILHVITHRDEQIQTICLFVLFCFFGGGGRDSPQWARASSFTRFLNHKQLRTTVGKTFLDEWSACRKDLNLTAHNTHNRLDILAPGGIRTQNLSRRADVDLRLRLRSYRDRLSVSNNLWNPEICILQFMYGCIYAFGFRESEKIECIIMRRFMCI
jgi:hypothetical protein